MPNKKNMKADKGLSLGKVAEYCGVTRKTVLRWVQSGLLSSFALPSGHNRVMPKEVIGFLRDHGMPVPEQLQKTAPLTALVCDDDAQIRHLMTNLLKNYFAIAEAANGVEACMMLGESPPDLLVLDIRMPKMDGLAVCRQIRKMSKCAMVKVVIVSAFIDKETRQALDGLADAIVTKPFSSADFIRVCLAAVGEMSSPQSAK
jgi:CheY-like chemotaxis protein